MASNLLRGLRPEYNPELKEMENRMRSAGYIFEHQLVLGAGSYASVYLTGVSRQKQDIYHVSKGVVAMKVINKKNVPFGYKEFIAREVANHKRVIKHANIVHLYQMFGSVGFWYLPMEYCSQGNMLELLQRYYKQYRCGLEDGDAQHYFNQLLSAVHHCHQKGIVHRDLKLENLLIDEQNNLKLSDFGFSTSIPYSGSLLREWCGSIQYAAPEILLRQWYDGKLADMWSLGVILYTLVNGRQPMQDCRRLSEILELARTQNYRMHRKVSKEAVFLILQILQIDPQRRPVTEVVMRQAWCQALRLAPDTKFPRIGQSGAHGKRDDPLLTPRDPLHWRNQKSTINVGKVCTENIKLKSRNQASRRVLNRSCGMGMIWKPAQRLAEIYKPPPPVDNMNISNQKTFLETRWQTKPKTPRSNSRLQMPIMGQRLETAVPHLHEYEHYGTDVIDKLFGLHMELNPREPYLPYIGTHGQQNWVTVKELAREFQTQKVQGPKQHAENRKICVPVTIYGEMHSENKRVKFRVPCRIPRLVPGYVFECGSSRHLARPSITAGRTRASRIPIRTPPTSGINPIRVGWLETVAQDPSYDPTPVIEIKNRSHKQQSCRDTEDQQDSKSHVHLDTEEKQDQCFLPDIGGAAGSLVAHSPLVDVIDENIFPVIERDYGEKSEVERRGNRAGCKLPSLPHSPIVNIFPGGYKHTTALSNSPITECQSPEEANANQTGVWNRDVSIVPTAVSISSSCSSVGDLETAEEHSISPRSETRCQISCQSDRLYMSSPGSNFIDDDIEVVTRAQTSESGLLPEKDEEGNSEPMRSTDEDERVQSRRQPSINQLQTGHLYSSWHDLQWLTSSSSSSSSSSVATGHEVIGDQAESGLDQVSPQPEIRVDVRHRERGSWSSAPANLHLDLSQSRQSSRPQAGRGFDALGRFSIAQVHTPNFDSSCSEYPPPRPPSKVKTPVISAANNEVEALSDVVEKQPSDEGVCSVEISSSERPLAGEEQTVDHSPPPSDATYPEVKTDVYKKSSSSLLPPIPSANRGVYPVTTFDPCMTLRCLFSTGPISTVAKTYVRSRTLMLPSCGAPRRDTSSKHRRSLTKGDQRSSKKFKPEGLKLFPWLEKSAKSAMVPSTSPKVDAKPLKTLRLPPLILPLKSKKGETDKINLAIRSCPPPLQGSAESARTTMGNSYQSEGKPPHVRRQRFQDTCHRQTRETRPV